MMSDNTSKARDNSGSSHKSFLFLLTDFIDPGIGLTGDKVIGLGNAVIIQKNKKEQTNNEQFDNHCSK